MDATHDATAESPSETAPIGESRTGLRVLHVTECYAGGVSRAINTAVTLAPEHAHHLLWTGDERPADTLPFATTTEMPDGLLSRVSSVKALVKSLKPDVVFAHSSWAGVYTRLLKLDVPVVYEPHCYKFDDMSEGRIRQLFFYLAEKALAMRGNATAVLSPHEDALTASLSAKLKRHFVPNIATVSPSDAYPAAEYVPGMADIMIGRISSQKDPDFYLQTALLVRERHPETSFIWVGDGDPDAHKRLVAAGVEVTGWLEEQQMMEVLSRPALYFHCARYEGFPLSILDAAIFEHPVVARRIPAFEGLPIPTEETTRGCADLICDALEHGDVLEQAKAAAQLLNQTMNAEAQRSALRAIFESI